MKQENMLPLHPVLLVLFLLFLTATAAVDMSNNLIPKVCDNSSRADPNIRYTFCTASLQSAPDSPCAALRHLGTISIRLVKFNATNTRCYIRQLLKNTKLTPYVRQGLNDCDELYSDALSTVRKAAKAYGAKNYADANIHLSSVSDAPLTCEQGFTERKGVKSPLTKRNDQLFQLSAIALSMINMMVH
uniref:Pectinesterase inhibitor domain-containing protein n=1 Tax=Kalanchoe fedtschenkoi TaxID=63787 RepID=A0A7N0UK34_KALFE